MTSDVSDPDRQSAGEIALDEALPSRPGMPFPVVGIGASAGGVEALQHFFDQVPSDSGFAYVVVLHLSPDSESHLAEIIATHSAVPVILVTESAKIEPDNVYVISPGSVLSIQGGLLRPDPIDAFGAGHRTQIDSFFTSLAKAQGELAACVILSGTGSDGTMGLRAIKTQGGFCVVQSHAQHEGMPANAIATGIVDRVLDTRQIPAAIAEYFRRLDDDRGATGNTGAQDDVRDQLPRIAALMKARTRHDFSNYKQSTLVRRVQRRMYATSSDTVVDYVKKLHDEIDEADLLLKELLIGVTEFFRDPDAFATLRQDFIPRLFENREPDNPVRAWVAGCATGEEAYSIAMMLIEQARQCDSTSRITVFATDIDTDALTFARHGRYPAAAMARVPPDLMRKYFETDGEFYKVRDSLRETILFSEHNALRDPPFSRLDLVSCRNVLIYLDASIQESILQTFHYVLRDTGYLMLGASETIGRESRRFEVADLQHHIYRPRLGAAPAVPILPLAPSKGFRLRPHRPHRPSPHAEWQLNIERLLLQRFTPAWVVVTEELTVLSFSGQTGKYLEVPPGSPTIEVIDLAKVELRPILRTALSKAFRSGERLSHRDLTIEADGGRQKFDLIVEPLPSDSANRRLCLVVFQETEPLQETEKGGRRHDRELRERHIEETQASQRHSLEDEVDDLRDRLRATTEELETTNEELRASNEELASMNEELQSANEELETSKEELQSSNEELQTVNSELNQRLTELSRVNADLRNLFENAGVATLFVDQHLCVRNFTSPLTRIFHIVETDKGRPIEHIAHRIDDDGIVDTIRGVIDDLQRVERQISLKDGHSVFIMRLQPYRTLDNRIDGAVVTFADVSQMKAVENRLELSERHHALLLREMHHRVKNLLANIKGLASLTYGESADLEHFRDAFMGRLDALGRAQNLLGSGERDAVNLKDLVREELFAHAARLDGDVSVEGPALLLEGRIAQTFALAIHELATNAVKYGALSSEKGRIAVSWRVDDNGDGGVPWLSFNWVESGLALDSAPKGSGFGRQLLQQALPYEFGAECRLEFPRTGCRCTIRIPFSDKVRLAESDPAADAAS